MVNSNPVTDLSPVAGKAIIKLGVGHTQITDWTPLQAMPLKTLAVAATGFSRLDQLKAADLEWLAAAADADILKLRGFTSTVENTSTRIRAKRAYRGTLLAVSDSVH
jgi:hypothetical protein